MANGILNTLNPKLSYIDMVLFIFQTVRWYGGTGGARGGHGWGTREARVEHEGSTPQFWGFDPQNLSLPILIIIAVIYLKEK